MPSINRNLLFLQLVNLFVSRFLTVLFVDNIFKDFFLFCHYKWKIILLKKNYICNTRVYFIVPNLEDNIYFHIR